MWICSDGHIDQTHMFVLVFRNLTRISDQWGQLLINMHLKYMKTKPLRSLKTINEAVLQTIFELLTLENNYILELCLVMNPKKRYKDGRYGSVNILHEFPIIIGITFQKFVFN